MNQKIEYIRYIHQFLLYKKDSRAKQIRDWLYHNSDNSELIMRLNLNWGDNKSDIFEYPDILSYKQWIRDKKIDLLLD